MMLNLSDKVKGPGFYENIREIMTNTWEIFEQILFLEIHMVGQIQIVQIHIRGKVQILQIQIAQIQIIGEIRIQTQIEIRIEIRIGIQIEIQIEIRYKYT